MNKLATLVEKMRYEDLVKLQKDLHAGNLDKLLSKRLEELRPTKARYCPVCQADINPNTNLSLTFGPAELRQRASFDAPDCLIYFLHQLRKDSQTNDTPHTTNDQ